MPSPSTELAWAAGFFDGEGSVSLHKRDRTLYVQVGQTDHRPLDRFVDAVGRGKVNGPHKPATENRKPTFKVAYYGEDAYTVMHLLEPLLSAPKLDQLERAVAAVKAARG